MSNQMTKQVQDMAAEEKTERERLIQKAKAEGNPWAQMIGMFPDDEITRLWIEEMKAARQRAEENLDYS